MNMSKIGKVKVYPEYQSEKDILQHDSFLHRQVSEPIDSSNTKYSTGSTSKVKEADADDVFGLDLGEEKYFLSLM